MTEYTYQNHHPWWKIGDYYERHDPYDEDLSTCPNCGRSNSIGTPYSSGLCICGAEWLWDYSVENDMDCLTWLIDGVSLYHAPEEVGL